MLSLFYYITLIASMLLAHRESKVPIGEEGAVAADSVSITIPFTRVGNLIMIKARVDTMEGNFVLDTGAPHLVLNITYFRDYPASQHNDAEQTGIGGATPTVTRSRVKEFEIGTMGYNNLDVDLVNLGHIENSKGVKILGLLGLDLFRQCEMIIDFEQGLIHLHRIARKEEKQYGHAMLQDTSTYRSMPIELVDSRIMVSTALAGKKLKFVVDCAAESNVLDSRLPDRILDLVTITRRVVITGSNNRKVDALVGDLQSIRIGGEEISNLPVLLTNLENTCFSYAGCVDGVLGFDFLSMHKVGFNFVKRKMYIWK